MFENHYNLRNKGSVRQSPIKTVSLGIEKFKSEYLGHDSKKSTSWTQDINGTYIKCSQDTPDVF